MAGDLSCIVEAEWICFVINNQTIHTVYCLTVKLLTTIKAKASMGDRLWTTGILIFVRNSEAVSGLLLTVFKSLATSFHSSPFWLAKRWAALVVAKASPEASIMSTTSLCWAVRPLFSYVFVGAPLPDVSPFFDSSSVGGKILVSQNAIGNEKYLMWVLHQIIPTYSGQYNWKKNYTWKFQVGPRNFQVFWTHYPFTLLRFQVPNWTP